MRAVRAGRDAEAASPAAWGGASVPSRFSDTPPSAVSVVDGASVADGAVFLLGRLFAVVFGAAAGRAVLRRGAAAAGVFLRGLGFEVSLIWSFRPVQLVFASRSVVSIAPASGVYPGEKRCLIRVLGDVDGAPINRPDGVGDGRTEAECGKTPTGLRQIGRGRQSNKR